MSGETKKNLQQLLQKKGSLYLVEWTFGPSPQEFIRESRKVRDIAMSSLILSMGLRWLLDDVLKNYEPDIVLLPYLAQDTIPGFSQAKNIKNLSLPNRCILILESLDTLQSDKINDLWLESAKKTLKEEYKKEDIPRIFTPCWVAMKIESDSLQNKFCEHLKELQKLMVKRKLTRNFSFWKGTSIPKCTMCFSREIADTTKKFWEDIRTKFPVQFKDKEQLCPLCLVKRLMKPCDLSQDIQVSFSFDSTTDVCCSLIQDCLKKNPQSMGKELKELLKCYSKRDYTLYDENFPSDFFYPQMFKAKSLQTIEGKKINTQKINQQNKEALSQIGFSNPPDYYAIIRLDADNMGKWTSGEFFTTFSPEELRGMSHCLHFLANSLYPFIIKEIWGGTLIYSSGDELLALGPMIGGPWRKTAISIAQLLRKAFLQGVSAIEDFLRKDERLKKEFDRYCKESKPEFQKGFEAFVSVRSKKIPSVSCGLTIVHHQAMLYHSLQEAIHTENFAKEEAKRDALAISILVRSGSPMTVGAKWDLKNDYSLDACLETIIHAMTNEDKNLRYSPGWLYDLMEVGEKLLVDASGNEKSVLEILEYEAERLLGRHKCKNKEHHKKQESGILEAMKALLQGIIKETDKVTALPYTSYEEAQNRSHQMILETWLRMLAFWVRSIRATFNIKQESKTLPHEIEKTTEGV